MMNKTILSGPITLKLLPILFWGACWGIAEASIGYVLHWAAIALPGLPGFLMFPFAFFFMYKAVQTSGQAGSALGAALVAAGIKLLDLALPGNIPLRVLNPALSILLEGVVVMLVSYYLLKKGIKWQVWHIFTAALGWRLLFLGNLAIILQFGLPAALITDGILVTLRYLLLESLVNSLLILALLKIPAVRTAPAPASAPRTRPVLTLALLLVAASLQLVL
jgi:hypothetical protein